MAGELDPAVPVDDARVRFLRLDTNLGVAMARNVAVSQARTPWIAFLDHDDTWSPNKLQLQLELLRATPGAWLSYTGFEWIECHARDDSVLAYMRKAKNPADFLVVVCNFTPVVRENYPIGVPHGGWYQEVFNSDSQFYGGSNVGNFPGLMAQEPGWHGRPNKLLVKLPPLGVTVLKPERR